ncbi:hypothetical protein Esti_005487 [Eimeria stiedai]
MPYGGIGRARRQGGGGARQREEKGPPSSKKEEPRKQSYIKEEDRQQQLPAVDTPEDSKQAPPSRQAAWSSVSSSPVKETPQIREEDVAEAEDLLIGRAMEVVFPPLQSPGPASTDTETAFACSSTEAANSLFADSTYTAATESRAAAASVTEAAAAAAAASDHPPTLAAGQTWENRSSDGAGGFFSGVGTPDARHSPTSFEHPPDIAVEAPCAHSSSIPDIDSRNISNKNCSSDSGSSSSSSSMSSSSSSSAVIRPLAGSRGYDASKDTLKPRVVSKPEAEALIPVSVPHTSPSALLPVATRRLWLLVFSVLLTWVQDPLLSLLASAAAARMQQGASLAVVAVGAGGQVPDGMCLLLVALGSAVGALCSRLGSPCPSACKNKGGPPNAAAAAAAVHTERQQARSLTGALRVAAVGAWLAAGLGVVVASSLYAGSEVILSFFLTIKGSPPPAAAATTAAAPAAAAADRRTQELALSLASHFLQLRCLSLPWCIVALTAKAALLTFRDFTPQLVTLGAATVAAPLLFVFSASAAAAASPAAAAAAFAHAAACTVSTVQVLATLLLLLRLGVLVAAATEQEQQQQQQQRCCWLQQLRAVCWLYRPPLFIEVKAFAPFVVPVLTQCCVRMVLYSSMTKAASLWGPKAMAAHQVVNSAMPKGTGASTTSGRLMQKRIFKVAACTAALSAAAQLVIVAVLTSRLWESDKELSKTAFYMGLCASVPLLFLPFASVMEGLLLRDLRGATVAQAYAATLPAPLFTMIAAEYNAIEIHRAFLQEEMPLCVCLLWILPLVYNVIKLAIMGFKAPRADGRPALLSKDAPV